MIATDVITPPQPRRWLVALRWSAAALVVAAAHGGLALLVLNWKPANAEAAAGASEPAVLIELAALSIAPEAPAEELPPAPQPVEPVPAPTEPVRETPPETAPPPSPEPVVEPPPQEAPPPEPTLTPVQVPEPEIVLPELPSIPDALAVLAPPPQLPPKQPQEIEQPVRRKPPPPKPQIIERKLAERPRERRAAAPPPAPPRASAPYLASQGAAAQPQVSMASWRGSLIAHLNRYKRFPGDADPGTVQVAFAIDRSGNVVSARLASSSGNTALDQEAVSMIRRASPVPAPPAGLGSGTIALAMPIRFSR